MIYRGRAYRAHDPRWAWSPTSGEGARANGGRFNRAGTAALYMSLDLDTALCEARQGFDDRLPPLTIVDYDIDVDPVADLTDASKLDQYGLAGDMLNCPWKRLALDGEPVPIWAIADLLLALGFAGIIAQSLAPNAPQSGKNLALVLG